MPRCVVLFSPHLHSSYYSQNTFFIRQERPDTIIDLGGNVLSPVLIDNQINGAYNFDFSEFDGKEESVAAYRDGLDMVARRIVETGVTSLLPTVITQTTSLFRRQMNYISHFLTKRDCDMS